MVYGNVERNTICGFGGGIGDDDDDDDVGDNSFACAAVVVVVSIVILAVSSVHVVAVAVDTRLNSKDAQGTRGG